MVGCQLSSATTSSLKNENISYKHAFAFGLNAHKGNPWNELVSNVFGVQFWDDNRKVGKLLASCPPQEYASHRKLKNIFGKASALDIASTGLVRVEAGNCGFQGMATKALVRKKTKAKLTKMKSASKYKLKPLSSWEGRFWALADGQMKRHKAGTRHNAHCKSRRRRKALKGSVLVHPTWVKKMKKMNFRGS
eukprot:CAMPEP_0196576408 /NCGR_PEP_ID=MMETSP1081-20130531/5675_1 /TAXON_ID=36882 /ORGANISM="Pyramimonas amylifera, Strain CCMP720" /LENGTH=191 /DNA_ID=CAMNT_0041895003 /DNA_START=248 /DNA_END=823 /DNA_ORIENTATION=-